MCILSFYIKSSYNAVVWLQLLLLCSSCFTWSATFISLLFMLSVVVYISLLILQLVCLFYSGFTSLSTLFQSYRDGFWMWQGAQCSLLECCLTEISRPRHLTWYIHPVTLYWVDKFGLLALLSWTLTGSIKGCRRGLFQNGAGLLHFVNCTSFINENERENLHKQNLFC